MKRFILCCLSFLTASFASVSHADTLLEENWDNGTIDPLVWRLSQGAIDDAAIVVLDAVNGDPDQTGDKALMYVASGEWGKTIESVRDDFPRNTNGDGLVMEFSIWLQNHPPLLRPSAGNQGINGPFHDPNGTIQGPPTPPSGLANIWRSTVEFGTVGSWSRHAWSEDSISHGINTQDFSHLDLRHSGHETHNPDTPFARTWTSRFAHGGQKFDDPETPRLEGALRVRYTLGATQGGMIEWFNPEIDEETQEVVGWVLEGDFRDGNLGPVIQAGPGEDNWPVDPFQQGSSSAPFVRLGWFNQGFTDNSASCCGNCPSTCTPTLDVATGMPRIGVFIDDIIVYAGTKTTGACNFTASCRLLTETECLAQGGTYAGDGAECLATFNIPGDCNQDGTLDLSDVVHLLGFLFQGNPEDLPCSTMEANLALMDCNQDDGIDLSDAIFKLAFLFQGGPPPDQGEGCISINNCPPNQACP